MTVLVDILAGLAILGGSLVVGVAALGLVRLRDPFMRMHAATKAGVVGAGLIVLGSAMALAQPAALVLGVLCVVFLVVTSPIASHALGRAAYISGAPIAPETVSDALGGILPRNVFDIAPGRSARSQTATGPLHRSPHTFSGVYPMSALESSRPSETERTPAIYPVRSLAVWLVGGDRQQAAIEAGLSIAEANGAKLVGLSAIDHDAGNRAEMVPIGGLAWSKWLGDRERLAHRERAAAALATFETRVRGARGPVSVRHAEGTFRTVVGHAAGNDLVVVPAFVDHAGRPAHDGAELAARLSGIGMGPVLRAARTPDSVRRVVLPVSAPDASARAVQALIRSGLWRDAHIGIIPVGAPSNELDLAVAQQIELLGAHGYRAVARPAIGVDPDRETLDAVVGNADACVAPFLTGRRDALDVFRLDPVEFAAARVPLFLLP